MKIEPALVKEILDWCQENLPNTNNSGHESLIKFSKYSQEQIHYHIKQLNDGGYLDTSSISADNRTEYYLNDLTWNGHQYIALLNSKAWNTAKSILHETGVIFAEAAIKAIIDKYGTNLPY